MIYVKLNYYYKITMLEISYMCINKWILWNRIIRIGWLFGFYGISTFVGYHIYQPLRSGRIWHKVNF